jgi:hypothetical protein
VTEADQGDIERFVRGTLGCGCPDEVFRTVSVSRLPAVRDRPPVLQLLIGSRLLIHVAVAPADSSAADWLEQLATNGRSARDRHGYNRFRLVIATVAPGCTVAGLDARFARALARDERAHLHVLDAAQLPAELAMTSE